MSGLGKRFRAAGYKVPKPLIPIIGKPMIAHVLEMYRGWDDVLFIVNENHLSDKSLRLEETLMQYCPTGKIFSIASHNLGPSYAVLKARDLLNPETPAVINYCDFSGRFNLQDMENKLTEYDSLVMTYTGFHPHTLRSSKFAYIKKNANGEVIDIQEKQSYSDDPSSEEASAGAYGFRNARLLIDAIEYQVKNQVSFQGEFYTSLTIKSLLKLNGSSSSFLMDQFFQWGTPEDLSDFNYWNSSLENINRAPDNSISRYESNAVILAGGRSQRVSERVKVPKPAIKVGGTQLWELALRSVNSIKSPLLVVRDEVHPFLNNNHRVTPILLKEVTRGQAESALFGIRALAPNDEAPLHVLASDNVLPELFADEVVDFMNKFELDVVVWSADSYPPSKMEPEHFSWVRTEDNIVRNTLYKGDPSGLPGQWEVVTGNFTFKKSAIALLLIEELLEKEDLKINNEFYLDSVISLGQQSNLRIGAIPIPGYFSLGTVNELETFRYWEDFLKWKAADRSHHDEN
jgi:NDP-sugar pyrophosphorylase family protein